MRRLVLLSFFQAQAEKRKSDNNAPSIIYAIEEPETSQHPNHQMLLIKSLIELSEQNNTQVMFTSHNANLVREIPIQSLRYISQVPDALLVEYGLDSATGLKNEETIQKIIQTLGILPNPADKVKIIVFVEGNHDVNGLKRYSLILNSHDDTILDLNSDDIAWIIVGGSSLKHYIENNYLEGLGKPQVHIYDSDVPVYIDYVAKINAEGNPNKVAFKEYFIQLLGEKAQWKELIRFYISCPIDYSQCLRYFIVLAYYRLGEIDEAYELLIKPTPEFNYDYWLLALEIYIQVGDKDKTMYCLKRMYAIFPENIKLTKERFTFLSEVFSLN